MENISIITISDIHFNKNEAENQGMVLSEFFNDLKGRVGHIHTSNLYCIIAGDLVQSGNVNKPYNDFYNAFIKKLRVYVPFDHIYVTPGNHDLNRNLLKEDKWKKKHDNLIAWNSNETEFNEAIKEHDSVICKKFQSFNEFCTKTLQIENYDLFGYSVNLIPEISVFLLNSALLSSGGLDGFPKDEGLLRIETSGLYNWVQNNEGRKKILVMHHPIHHLTEYAQKELTTLIKKNIDILITGHLHDQDYQDYLRGQGDSFKKCSSPQLFSDKHDNNGYSILHFEGDHLMSIEYRKWSSIQRTFCIGMEFSNTDDGYVRFSQTTKADEDLYTKDLELELQKSLTIYNYHPQWVNRVLSNIPPKYSTQEDNEIRWDHINVINSDENIRLISGGQFGLTTFARKLLLEAWKLKREYWLYIDAKNLRLSQLNNIIEDFVKRYNITNDRIKTVIWDNWKQDDELQKLQDKILKLIPASRNIVLDKMDDYSIVSNTTPNESPNNYKRLYLRELTRTAIRQITTEFMRSFDFDLASEDVLLERLIIELMDLNVHRTPVNCIQILMGFKQNYEARPVNRAKVLSAILQFFFMKPDSFFYTKDIDEEECCQIMGALCEQLARKDSNNSYTRQFCREFYTNATQNLQDRYTKTLIDKLFKSMLEAQILVENNELYEFRFSYWQCYFTAYQMYVSDEFYAYMIDTQKCYYMPDIVEFYTGINHKCSEFINEIITQLSGITESVNSSIGIKIINPYASLKWEHNPNAESKTREQLDSDIKESRLPSAIKDAVLDSTAEIGKPYFQAIERVFDKYNVRNMMSLARSASRALRNSNFITDTTRRQLFNAVNASWVTLTNVLLLLTPALVRVGHGEMGGASFRLSGKFPEDDAQKVIAIITAIPQNIVQWYLNDVFSDKRLFVYKESISNDELHPIARHINALMLADARPSGWKNILSGYIENIGKNSYYLGDITQALRTNYALATMSDTDLRHTRLLIQDAYEKHKKGSYNLLEMKVNNNLYRENNL